MSFNQQKLEDIIQNSCEELFAKQPMLVAKINNISEKTTSNELSKILSGYFEEYHVNCEYNRMSDEYGKQIEKKIYIEPIKPNPSSVFPDIIVHRQEDNKHNLLVIEIKMSWKNKGKERDKEKLKLYLSEIGYQYGLYLEIGEFEIVEMEWFLQPNYPY